MKYLALTTLTPLTPLPTVIVRLEPEGCALNGAGNLLAPWGASVVVGVLRSGYSRVQLPRLRRRRAELLSKLKVLSCIRCALAQSTDRRTCSCSAQYEICTHSGVCGFPRYPCFKGRYPSLEGTAEDLLLKLMPNLIWHWSHISSSQKTGSLPRCFRQRLCLLDWMWPAKERAGAKGQEAVYTLHAALEVAVCLQASLGDDAEASLEIIKQAGMPEPCPKGEDGEKRD